MPPSETLSAADLMAVVVEAAEFPLVRLAPRVGPEERAGAHGPLYQPSASRHAVRRTLVTDYLPRELLEALLSLTHARCRLAGAQTVTTRIVNTWSAVFAVPASDAEIVAHALRELLHGEEGALRSYLNSPPQLVRAGEVLAPHGRQLSG